LITVLLFTKDKIMTKLPEPAHRGPIGTGEYFSSYTKEQMLQFRFDALEEAVAVSRKYNHPIAGVIGHEIIALVKGEL
jgi:hypothetical protein